MKPRSYIEARRSEDAALVREIVTPEGVALRVTLARAGDRAGAFLLDMLLQVVVLFAVSWGLSRAVDRSGQTGSGSWLTAVVVILAFLFVNFYFVFFEVHWQGATWGKRLIGIRVIDARGGQLETSAVLARNLIRELEVWMPLRFLFAGGLIWPGAPAWAQLCAGAWVFVFLFMPLFNKDRLRVGDMIAGTRVVMEPKVVLAPDLVDVAPPPRFGARPVAAHAFSDAQLAIYGIFELQVLETVLRDAPGLAQLEAMRTISEKVRRKIGYEARVSDDEGFLREFYAAQRAHLEQKLLFGKRRADKFAR